MSWYYAENDKQNGPVTDAEWQSLVASGRITPTTLVWQEGMAAWQAYSTVAGAALPVGAPLIPGLPGSVTCAYCKKSFPSDEVISMNGQMVCATCKPVAVQMMKEGVSAPGELNYAGFWIRFAAKFIDGIIGWIVGAVVGLLGGLIGSEAASIAASLLGVIIQAGYIIYFLGKYGATLGKMACGLRVVRPDGQSLSYGRATGRYFAEWVSAFTLLIGYIIAAFDPEKRALHDRIVDTRVVKK